MKQSERSRRLIPNLYRYPEPCIDNGSHSISPISQNDCQVKGRTSETHFKTCGSNEHSRNVTPTNINFYSVQTLNTNRNSVVECSNCSKIEKKLRNSNQNLQKLKEKQLISAKHLNQYESLLKIKENRLNEREKTLNEQILLLENEKQKALLEKSASFSESEQKSRLTCASNSQILQKNQEFSGSRGKFQENSKKNQGTSTDKFENDSEARIFDYFKEIFKVKEENLAFKEAEIERNKQKLIKEKEEFEKTHEEIFEMREKIRLDRSEMEKQWKTLKEETFQLNHRKNQLEIDSLALDRSRVTLENETKLIRESYEVKCKELESWKTLSESRISTEQINKASPEKISEFNIEPFDELSFGKNVFSESGKFSEMNSLPGSVKESSLNRKIFTPQEMVFFEQENPNKSTYISRDSREENLRLGIIEQIRARFDQKSLEFQHQLKLKDLFFSQETEKFQNQIQELESSVELLKDQNSKLQNINEKLNLKLNKLKKDTKTLKREKGFDQLDEIIEKVQEKVKNLKEKEEEILGFKKHLNCEQETLMNEAECLKILYQEMNKEKIGFCEQKEELFIQKKALIEIEKMHKEKVELLEIKEKELAKLKDELINKETNLRRNFTRTVRIPKRINTHQAEFSEECLIFK